MRASKESARIALQQLTKLSDGISQEDRTRLASHVIYLQEFIEAAEGKLPTEAAYDAERQRRRKVPVKKAKRSK